MAKMAKRQKYQRRPISLRRGGMNLPWCQSIEQTKRRASIAKMTVAQQLLCVPEVAFSFRARIQIFSQEPAGRASLCGAWRLEQFFRAVFVEPSCFIAIAEPPLPAFELGAALQPAAHRDQARRQDTDRPPSLRGERYPCRRFGILCRT